MGLLGDIFSYSDGLKRKLRGLLDDPVGTVDLGVRRFAEDQNKAINDMRVGYGLLGDNSVLVSEKQKREARKALSDYGANMGLSAATVWHGSPHKFDKFDSSKIGTGEGAQAYGHGIYVADSPAVAQGYQERVTALRMPTDSVSDAEVAAAKKLLTIFGPKDGATQVRRMVGDRADEVLRKASEATGNLYKVDLPDEHIAKMLDWDKPLSQQAPEVQAIFGSSNKMTGAQALKAIEANPEQYFSQTMSGKDLTGAMIRPERGSSEFLRQKGIPGIRYLDGGSRGAGQGTSNFVVFPGNEGLLKILERNGIPIE